MNRSRVRKEFDDPSHGPGAAGRSIETETRRKRMAKHGYAVVEPATSLLRGRRGRATQGLMALLRERRRLLEHVPAPRETTPDPLDAAKDLEEQQLWLAVSDRREEIHDQIEEAVRLLIEGRYGRCIECGMAIPAARLRALPFALRCLTCQERVERSAHLVGWFHSAG